MVLYGGPGTGKSTTAAALFAELKMRGRNVELVPEVAKGFTWEKRTMALAHQPYIIAKQMLHLDRLDGQVEAVVTDTSTLLALIYGVNLTQAFRDWVIDDYHRRKTINILLRRNDELAYDINGRHQTEVEALAADRAIRQLLFRLQVDHSEFMIGAPKIVMTLADLVEERLA